MLKNFMSVVFFSMISLSATAATFTNITEDYELPSEMSDCKIFYLKGGGFSYSSLYVTQCPNSKTNTSYKSGKTEVNIVNGDPDVPYAAQEKPVVIEYNGSKYVKIPN